VFLDTTEVVMPMVLLAFGLGILNVCLGFAKLCQLYASYAKLRDNFQPFSAFFSLIPSALRHTATCCDMLRHLHRIGSRHLPPLLMDVASQFGADAPAAFNISEGGGEIAEPKD
jgi:hypothetical protein